MITTKPSCNAQQGFTLLEVMVALAIFALTGTAIIKAVGENLNAVGQLESITFANWVANNQLTRVQLEQKWPIRNNLQGSVEMGNREWFWVQTVTATNEKNLKQVTVTVGLDPNYEGSITSVSAYFAKPSSKSGTSSQGGR